MSQATNAARRDHDDDLKAVNEHASTQVLTSCKVHPNITVHYGNIFDIKADAIVNAANSGMLGGGGIDGQIHCRAGPKLRNWIRENVDADRWGDRLEPGKAIATPGFDLDCQIIHTVGPIVDGAPTEEDAATLAACYENAVDAARFIQVAHIAVPCISTGVYGYPMLDAAQVELAALARALDRHPDIKVTAVVFNDVEQTIWRKLTA